MPITVKKIILWRSEVDNKPGTLASTIEPPAKAGADLKIMMGYRHPTAKGRAAIEVFPIAGKKLGLYSRICGRAATAETDPLAGASSKKHGAGGSIGGGESV